MNPNYMIAIITGIGCGLLIAGIYLRSRLRNKLQSAKFPLEKSQLRIESDAQPISLDALRAAVEGIGVKHGFLNFNRNLQEGVDTLTVERMMGKQGSFYKIKIEANAYVATYQFFEDGFYDSPKTYTAVELRTSELAQIIITPQSPFWARPK